MIIRPAVAADCAALSATDRQGNPSAWSENQFQAALNDRFTTVLLAELDGETAGFIVWQTVCGESELHLIATAEAHRKQGIASRLMKQWFQTALAEQAARLLLEVRASNTTAQNLYRQFGFTECGRRKNYYALPEGEWEDALLMSRTPPEPDTDGSNRP